MPSGALPRHGHARPGKKTRVYRAWRNMLDRCSRESRPDWKHYGGRGITVCKRWFVFENFLADMGEPDASMTLDRRDNDKGYNKRNCRWVSRKVQANNQRTNHHITFAGRTQTLAQWSEETNLKYDTLRCRLNDYGWSVEEALTLPAIAGKPLRTRKEK